MGALGIAGLAACNAIFGISSGEPASAMGGGGPGSGSSAVAGAGSGGSEAVSLQDCVLLLHMDETSWSGVGSVKDSSPQGNDGTPEGNAKPTANGKFGGAAELDGASWIKVPDSASLHPVTAVTYSAWVYPTGLTDGSIYPGVIAKRDNLGTNLAFTLFIWVSNNVYADVMQDGANRPHSSISLVNSTWYHLAVVFDGSSPMGSRVQIYVNGMPDGTGAADTSFTPTTADVTIGFLPQGGFLDPNAFFKGRIDEVAIWTRALTWKEIQALADAKTAL
jgi:hypothetical protein